MVAVVVPEVSEQISHDIQVNIDPVKVQPGTTNVTVGAGGQYATPPAMPGVAGGNSSIDPNSPETNTITATGGGGGGAPGQEPNPWGSSTNWWRGLVVLVEVVPVALVLMHQTILVVLVMRVVFQLVQEEGYDGGTGAFPGNRSDALAVVVPVVLVQMAVVMLDLVESEFSA